MTLTVDCQVAQKSQHFFFRPGCDDPQQGYLPVGNNVPGYQVETRPSTLCTPIIESFQLVAQLVDNIDVQKRELHHQAIASAGPVDCARMCSNVKDCVAWTLLLE